MDFCSGGGGFGVCLLGEVMLGGGLLKAGDQRVFSTVWGGCLAVGSLVGRVVSVELDLSLSVRNYV
jgi:hypothetical protein